jgi:hypothetical protein
MVQGSFLELFIVIHLNEKLCCGSQRFETIIKPTSRLKPVLILWIDLNNTYGAFNNAI